MKDLLPGLTYTIYVRSENVFTDQLPESLFENYSAIVRVSLPETTNSEVGTATLSTAETGVVQTIRMYSLCEICLCMYTHSLWITKDTNFTRTILMHIHMQGRQAIVLAGW